MQRSIPARPRALILSAIALAVLVSGTASAATPAPVTRTFSFIGQPKSTTRTLFNLDGMLVNARCDANGSPIVYAFSSSTSADLFGHVFDGLGRTHIIKDSSFVKGTGGDLLTTTSGDYDGSGVVLFETSAGKVVTVNYAFDNSTTLAKKNVCTVFGSAIAT